MNKQWHGMNERTSECMRLHTGRQGAGQGVEEGVNGGWRGPGTHPLPAVQEASKVHFSHLPPKNTQFEFHMQLADMSVCLSAHVCFVFVCVRVSMSILSQELEVKHVTRSSAGVCVDHECVSGSTGSRTAQMLRQGQALIHLTGTSSHQSASPRLMMSQPWLLQACWMSHQTVLLS